MLALLLLCNAHALRTPHPLLSSAAARDYRAQAGREFARVAPLIKAPLLQNSNKTQDLAAGKALLKKMDRATQTPADLTTVARRGYIRSVYDDRAFQVCELFGAAHRAGIAACSRACRCARCNG